ncbi:MAG: hypothetical protein AAFZ80_08050 [Cyanobacteria bacterium P01_A01_bin.105]
MALLPVLTFAILLFAITKQTLSEPPKKKKESKEEKLAKFLSSILEE